MYPTRKLAGFGQPLTLGDVLPGVLARYGLSLAEVSGEKTPSARRVRYDRVAAANDAFADAASRQRRAVARPMVRPKRGQSAATR